MPPALLHCLSPYDGPGVLCRAAYLLTLQSWAAALQVFTSVKLPKSAFGGHKDKSNSLSNDRTSYIWRQVLPQFPLLRVSSSTSSRCSLLRSGFLTSASWGHLPSPSGFRLQSGHHNGAQSLQLGMTRRLDCHPLTVPSSTTTSSGGGFLTSYRQRPKLSH